MKSQTRIFIPTEELNQKTVDITGNKKLAFALIGAGGMGKRWADALQRSEHSRLVLVVDKNIEVACAIAEKVGTHFSDYLEKSINEHKPDAAIVALPHAYLAETSEKLLRLGLHVICEKPAARTPAELEPVMQAAKDFDRRFMVGCNHRFHPSLQKAKEIVESGAIGNLIFIRGRYGFGGREEYAKEWRLNPEISGGGELIDQGIHLIDLARWFLGDIAETRGFVSDNFWRAGAEDNAFVLLRDKKNRIASLHASWTQWDSLFSFELYGSEGYIHVEGLGKRYGGTERVIWGKRSENFGVEKEEIIECDTDANKSLILEIEEFVSAIKEKRDPKPSGRDAFEVLKIVEEVYRSQES